MLRLLHLSDIHFNKPECLTARTSRDAKIRHLMLNEASDFAEVSETPIDAILVTGDIAFKADPEEFQVAKEWLYELADRLGSPKDAIYVVPGNHDVNRKVADSKMVKALRKTILSCDGEQRYESFVDHLRDSGTQKILMEPFESYNEFAKHFGCNIWAHDQAFWEYETPINERYTLRLNGLTTAFLSSEDDDVGKLYMGQFQSNVLSKPGVVDLAMFHHPFDWLSDGEKIEDDLHNNTQIILMGHRHRQRQRHNGTDKRVIFAAGAINPCRKEGSWEPAFNIIDLEVEEAENDAQLLVTAHLFRYQEDPEMFVPVKNGRTADYFEYKITIPKSPKPTVPYALNPSSIDKVLDSNDGANVLAHTEENEQVEPKDPQPSIKTLMRQYWELSPKRRREIINDFDVLTDDQLTLPEYKRVYDFFLKIQEDKLLDDLITQIEYQDK